MENSECFHKMQTKAKHEFTIKLELIEIQFQCKHYCYASSKLMHIHNKICHPYGNNLIISKYNKSAQAKGTCIVHTTEICWPSFAPCAPRPMPIRMMLLFFFKHRNTANIRASEIWTALECITTSSYTAWKHICGSI